MAALALVLLAGGGVSAQDRLTLQDAVARTLKHNFDISIADLAAQQAARNNTLGNAGFSPNVSVGASATKSWTNVQSDLSNGTTQNNPNAQSTNYNPYLQVTWTIFDGGKMFLVKKQLDKLQVLGELQLKAQVQAMVSRTVQLYAQVVWQKKQMIAIDTSLSLARTRMFISKVKFETGAGAKIDYLQALVDYSARQADSLNFIATLGLAADSLDVLMGELEGRSYVLDDTLPLNTTLQPADMQRLTEANLWLGTYKVSADISHLNADIAKTFALPTLAFNGVYNYSRTNNATGFTLYNRSYGPSGTLTVNMPLFQGGNIRRQARVASLQAMRDDLLYEKQHTILARQYRTAWKNYQVSVVAYQMEQEHIKYARENVDVQEARFRLGAGTTLESRQAENDYVTALVRLYTAAYNLKVNETVVLELENQLVK